MSDDLVESVILTMSNPQTHSAGSINQTIIFLQEKLIVHDDNGKGENKTAEYLFQLISLDFICQKCPNQNAQNGTQGKSD